MQPGGGEPGAAADAPHADDVPRAANAANAPGAADAPVAPDAPACANCGAPLHGQYCARCGQDSDVRTDSLRAFAGEVLADIAHFDSRGWRTLRDLFIRPGRLTAAYFSGKRVLYASPLQLYLIAAALFFFVNTLRPFIVFDGSTWSVLATLGVMSITQNMSPEERAPLEAGGITPEMFESQLRDAANDLLPAFLVAVVVAFAVLVAIVHLLRQRNLLVHVVFALHWTAFYFLLMIAERAFGTPPGQATFLGLILAVIGIAWLTVALRHVYRQLWALALIKAIALFITFHVLLALWVGGVLAWAIGTM